MAKRILYLSRAILFLVGIVLLSHIIEPSITDWTTERIGRTPTERTYFILKIVGWLDIFIAVGIQIYLHWVYPRQTHLAQKFRKMGGDINYWSEKTFGKFIDFQKNNSSIAVSAFNYQDTFILTAIFVFSVFWIYSEFRRIIPL